MDNRIKRFLDFNGKKVYFLNADGQWWIAIKPICEAMNIDYETQRARLRTDVVLAQLPGEFRVVAADGKTRKMVCLPERYIYGWLFRLTSKSALLQTYQRKCYDVLYDHFHGTITDRPTIIRERTVAEVEQQRLRREEAESNPRSRRIAELSGVILRCNKQLKAQDRALVQEQMDLFTEEPGLN